MNMEQKEFNVLIMNFNNKKIEPYNVLPYLRNVWKKKKFYYGDEFEKIEVNTKETLKKWIEQESRYNFWARCEYEFLVLPWPYNEERDKPYKLDVFEQIMYNIDIITDILFDEFLNKNE
jgi:hypothetical protein